MYGGWGGWGFDRGDPLSVLELVNAGNLDLRLASLLWLMMEKRASVLVAAGPSQAGKTTTLDVLLDFLRPEIKHVELQGYREDFSFIKKGVPSDTYLVAAEFSNHGHYVWGDTAVKAFQLLSRGYGLGGTIHAETAEEVVGILHHYLGLPLATIAGIQAIVTLYVAVDRRRDKIIRRIDAVSLVIPRNGGLALERIAWLDSDGDSFEIASEKVLQEALSLRLPLQKESVITEMEERERFLGQWIKDGKVSHDEVRQAVEDFYRSRPAGA